MYTRVLKIRLARHGRKGCPFYWIMVADARCPRETGKEKLGTYNPLEKSETRTSLKEDRVRYWLGCGAQPTDRVHRILSASGILPAYVHRETPQKSTPKKRAQERMQKKQSA